MKDGGYLLIDHTFSPGIPEDIARKIGLDPRYTGEGKRLEAATLTCAHCKTVVVKNPSRLREREHCFKCQHYICDQCAWWARQPDYVHEPFARQVEKHINATLGSPRILLPDEPA